MLLMGNIHIEAADFETAADAVKNMGLGWNLGNTLDAHRQTIADINDSGYWGQQGVDSETWWGQPVTKQALFKMMKEAGFSAIRIPVTWYNHMDANGTVNADWMKRVHEVVDYVINEGLYCIVNVHHDTGADGGDKQGNLTGYHWLKADETTYANNKERFEGLWRQIAEEFKTYDQRLLFEGYNEMLDSVMNWHRQSTDDFSWGSWCFASFNAKNRYDAASAASSYKGINSYAQSFVDAVRSTGGNNAQRNLIVNTYGACCGAGNWNVHLQDPLKAMELPDDAVANHLIFQVHTYPSLTQGLNAAKEEVNATIEAIITHLVSKGAPVIFGEWGTSGGSDYTDRHDDVLAFADYFVRTCKANGIGTFLWMGLSDGLYRSDPTFSQPDLAQTIAKAYHGDNYEGKYPVKDVNNGVMIFEGEKMLNWGVSINLPASLFSTFSEVPYIEVTYQQKDNPSSDELQFFYNDWSEKINVIVDGKKYGADFKPAEHYNTPVGTEHVTAFTFDPSNLQKIKQRGILFHGVGILVKKAELLSKPSTGISAVVMKADSENGTVYTLTGLRTPSPNKGIFIKDNKKFLKK